MANPNKTVARARKAMGGFQRTPEQEAARAARNAPFAAFMDWCVKQADAGVTFPSVEAAREAYEKACNAV